MLHNLLKDRLAPDHRGVVKRESGLDDMSDVATNWFAGVSAVLAIAVIIQTLLQMRKNKRWKDDRDAPSGARLVSRARYRGRRVVHYSDGTVLAETRFGFRSFENFDLYRQYIDR